MEGAHASLLKKKKKKISIYGGMAFVLCENGTLTDIPVFAHLRMASPMKENTGHMSKKVLHSPAKLTQIL
jgi:hypothetical protein